MRPVMFTLPSKFGEIELSICPQSQTKDFVTLVRKSQKRKYTYETMDARPVKWGKIIVEVEVCISKIISSRCTIWNGSSKKILHGLSDDFESGNFAVIRRLTDLWITDYPTDKSGKQRKPTGESFEKLVHPHILCPHLKERVHLSSRHGTKTPVGEEHELDEVHEISTWGCFRHLKGSVMTMKQQVIFGLSTEQFSQACLL